MKWSCRLALRNNLLVILTSIGVILGFILGLTVREASPGDDVIMWIGMPGEVYLRMLKMVILPLIICCVITGTASLDPRCNGKVSIVSLTYIVTSNCLAIIVPMIATLVIQPGHIGQLRAKEEVKENIPLMETADVFADLIRNLFPSNIVTACFEQTQTKYTVTEVTEEMNITDSNGTSTLMNVTHLVRKRGVTTVQSTNAIGLVIFGLVIGMASAALGEKTQAFTNFIHAASEVIIKVLGWFVWVTPIGVTSLIAVACLKIENIGEAIQSLGVFALIVVACLMAHCLLLLPAFSFFLVRINPYTFMYPFGRPCLVGFATASSAMAIPETMEALMKFVDARVARFVVPFATTINRDGTCIFMTIATIFVCQLGDHSLYTGNLILLWILITIIAMATPSVPSGSLVSIIIVLSTIGIPSDMVGMLFATEWILDRLRTTVNIMSHAHCALVTNHLCKGDLKRLNQVTGDQTDEQMSSMCLHRNDAEYNVEEQKL